MARLIQKATFILVALDAVLVWLFLEDHKAPLVETLGFILLGNIFGALIALVGQRLWLWRARGNDKRQVVLAAVIAGVAGNLIYRFLPPGFIEFLIYGLVVGFGSAIYFVRKARDHN